MTEIREEIKMRKWAAAMTLAVVMLLSAIPMVGSAAEDNPPTISDPVIDGTDLFGGGEMVHMELANGTDFGVIYGTQQNPNKIIIFAKANKYIGSVEAYDRNGNEIGQRMVKVGVIYAQTLDTLMEFNDTNENGIFDYSGFFPYTLLSSHEPTYKRVSLDTAWERSDILRTDDGNNITWSFSLTAHNLSYIPTRITANTMDLENSTLENLTFTFHLRAERIYVDSTSMPHFKLTLDGYTDQFGKERYRVVHVERTEQSISGWKSSYSVKYDQYIEGWDFDPQNSNPTLILVFHSTFGHFIPLNEAVWARSFLSSRPGDMGTARYRTDNGEEHVNETNLPDDENSTDFRSRHVLNRNIEIDDSWEKVARFTWVSNVSVDGEEMEMHAQIQGGVRRLVLLGDKLFTGFTLLGGLTYPGGNTIYHDPQVSGEAFTDIATISSAPSLNRGIFASLMAGILIVAGTGLYFHKKKRKKDFDDLAESALPEEKKI